MRKVIATQPCFIDGIRRKVGDIFHTNAPLGKGFRVFDVSDIPEVVPAEPEPSTFSEITQMITEEDKIKPQTRTVESNNRWKKPAGRSPRKAKA